MLVMIIKLTGYVQKVWAAGRENGAVHWEGGAVVRAHYRVAEKAALAEPVQRLHRRHRHAPTRLATRRLNQQLSITHMKWIGLLDYLEALVS